MLPALPKILKTENLFLLTHLMLLRQKTLEDWNFQMIPQHVSSDNKTVMSSVLNADPEYFFHTHKSQIDLFFSIKILLSAMIKSPHRSSQIHFREKREVLKIRRNKIIGFQYTFQYFLHREI